IIEAEKPEGRRESEVLLEPYPRTSGTAPLRRNDHDAGVCARTIDRGRRGSLQDLDGLDVLRIEICNTVGRVVVARIRAGSGAHDHRRAAGADRAVVDIDAVDD